METYMKYPLIQQFKHYQLDYMIPTQLGEYNNEDNVAYRTVINYDPAEEAYYECDRVPDEDLYEDEEMDEEETTEYIHNFSHSENPLVYDVDELMGLFGIDYLEPTEFLSLNIWDLFKITKKQFDMIDWDLMPDDTFMYFYDKFIYLASHRPDVSIEQRIKYATVDVLTHYSYLDRHFASIGTVLAQPGVTQTGVEASQQIKNYAMRIIDNHDIEQSRTLIKLYDDYLRFYGEACTMNQRRAEEGVEIFNYTLTPKPSHLQDLHDKAFRDYQALRAERAAANLERLNASLAEVAGSRKYTKFLFEDDDYVVLPATCYEDLEREGERLNHCVASYAQDMADENSFIYFIRRKSNPDIPFYTAEIIPEDRKNNVRGNRLTQLFGKDNTTYKPDDFRDFIFKWAKSRPTKFQIYCTV